MGRVRFRGRGRNRVRSIFLDSNVVPESTKIGDPGTCLTWQVDLLEIHQVRTC